MALHEVDRYQAFWKPRENHGRISVWKDGTDQTWSFEVLSRDEFSLLIRRLRGSESFAYDPDNEMVAFGGDVGVGEDAVKSLYATAVLADEPEAYWRLNETEGTTAADSSGNDHAGTFNGGVTLGQEGAFAGSQAAAFDGKTAYVEIPGTWGQGNELTVEAWVNVSQTSGDFEAIVSPLAQQFVHLQLHSGGNIAVYTDTGYVLMPIIAQTPLNEWRHIAFVIAPGNVRLYVDGEEVGASTGSFSAITSAETIRIGCGYQGGRFFNGRICEVAIYNHALNVERLQAHRDAAQAAPAAASSQERRGGEETESQTEGLVSHWPAEGNATDVAGANNGTLHGGVTFAAGKIGQAFSLNGTDAYVEVADAASLDISKHITIAAWIKPSALGRRIVDKISPGGGDGYLLDTYPANLRLIIDGQVLTSKQALPVDVFTHVVGTYDGSQLQVYINGALDNSLAAAVAIPTNNLPVRLA